MAAVVIDAGGDAAAEDERGEKPEKKIDRERFQADEGYPEKEDRRRRIGVVARARRGADRSRRRGALRPVTDVDHLADNVLGDTREVLHAREHVVERVRLTAVLEALAAAWKL